MDDAIFDPKNEVKQSIIKFGKVGDWIKGTLTDDTRIVPNKLNPAKGDQRVYEFKIKGGQFHDINDKVVDDEPTVLNVGDFYVIYGNKVMQSQLKNSKIGQVIGIRFSDSKPNSQPGYDDTKIIRVYLGEMDPEYQGESACDIPM